MAAKSFKIQLVTPQGKLLDAQATSCTLPAHDGSMGVLANRAPMVVKLGMGPLRVAFADSAAGQGGSREYLVEDGFAHMVDNKLLVLTSRAIPSEQIVEADAQAELSAAESKKPADTSRAQADALRKDRDRARIKVRLARSRAGKGI